MWPRRWRWGPSPCAKPPERSISASAPPPSAPRLLAPEVPPGLEAILLRCLAKAPADRFARATELATALREVVRALPAPPEDQQSLPDVLIDRALVASTSVDGLVDED